VAAAELRLVTAGLGIDCQDGIERVTDGRSTIVRFTTDAPEERVAAIVGRLSSSAALFAQSGPALRPITIVDNLMYGTELATVQRYRGKTNERLTRAMLNIALAGAGIDPADPTGTVLDPMCGRGTSLNWALAYGLDTIGVEIDGGSLDQHASFLQTWAKRQRLPHQHQRHRKGNAEQRVMSMEVAPDRQTLKQGKGQTVQTFHGDGGDRSLPIARRAVDAIVTDLPYGVQHRGQDGRSADAADTVPLLERALPTWVHWLRPGGALCLAWNLKRATRNDVGRLLADAGFKPVTVTGGHTMRHEVDATIDRDVIVAVK
jgi:SAM-dependent methyltransferase